MQKGAYHSTPAVHAMLPEGRLPCAEGLRVHHADGFLPINAPNGEEAGVRSPI